MDSRIIVHTATIPISAFLSNAINIGGETIVGFKFPVGFEGASITLHASVDFNGAAPESYTVVRDYTNASGNPVAIYTGTAAGGYVPVPPTLLASVQNFKILTPTITTAARDIKILTRRIV
jgi:hypothetical protein